MIKVSKESTLMHYGKSKQSPGTRISEDCISAYIFPPKQQRLKNIPSTVHKRKADNVFVYGNTSRSIRANVIQTEKKRQIKFIHSPCLIFRKAKEWFSWTLVPQIGKVYCATRVPTTADLRFGHHNVLHIGRWHCSQPER